MLNADAVTIWRAADGDYHIEWDTSHPATEVAVQAMGEQAGPVERDRHETGVRLAGLAPERTHYFRVSDQHGNEVVATERRLGMQGTPNFRDFGGYRTRDGRQVRWGRLFRSGQLATLSAQDVALMSHLQLDFVCDFRQEEEQGREPSRLPQEPAPRALSLPIVPGSNAAFFEQAGEGLGGGQAMFDFMLEINRDFALAQTTTYARMFREILAVEDACFLVHCAAGKDRTGFAAAIVLLALGVPRETVLADYLLTARYFHPQQEMDRIREKYQMQALASESILPMLEVHPDYLVAALEAIDERYESMEAYLGAELGVGAAERAELQRRYLI